MKHMLRAYISHPEMSIKCVFSSQFDPYITDATVPRGGERDRGTISGTHKGESAEQKARLVPPRPIESAVRAREARGTLIRGAGSPFCPGEMN